MTPDDRQVNILLVDDRVENLVALEAVLADLGQNLVRAVSGREALKQLLYREFAVILLDVQMPELDGFETARLIRLRDKTRHTPIIFLTAINKTDAHVARGYSIGAVDYVFKPFDPEVLRSKVAAFVELSKKTEALKAEIAQRQQAEAAVRKLNAELERRVRERTAALETANRELESEIAERRRAEAALRFLAEASASLASSLDYHVTLERVARLAVPTLADWCAVDMMEEDGRLSRLAIAHANRDKEALARELWQRYPPRPEEPIGLMHVLRTGQSELLPQVTDEMLESLAHDAEHLEILRGLGLTSVMAVPLVVRGRTLGGITLAASSRSFGPAELAFAEDLARRAGVAIDNARLFREVQEADRAKDQFLAMLAHELRNPLAPVRNAVEVMQVRGIQDPALERTCEVVERQIQNMSRLVDDLLDVSRIRHGRIELRKEVVDLVAVTRNAVETARSTLEARRHAFTATYPPQPLWVEADPVRLEQVLTNLLNNAAKYTEPGGQVSLSVERDTERKMADGKARPSSLVHQPPTVTVSVRDTGVGIAPDMLGRIFDVFTQADRSLDRSQGGLGLGLTLVRSLVEMHGGSVEARSEGLGRGSEFLVRLPLSRSEGQRTNGENGGRGARPLPESVFAPPRSRRILVVDDNVDAAETLAELLELWGHDVCAVHDGAAALEAVGEYGPEVVLLDIGLPGMDGYEVARRLREGEDAGKERMLLIAVTGYGQEEDRRRSHDATLDYHLTKPVDPEALRQVLERLPAEVT